jgi:hypothetical protein
LRRNRSGSHLTNLVALDRFSVIAFYAWVAIARASATQVLKTAQGKTKDGRRRQAR